jgi:hypothetical protein
MKRILAILLLCLACGLSARAQRISNANFATVGYIKSDGTVQDANYRTLGRIKNDGTVQDSSYRTLGRVKSDGTVQDSNYRTLGHAKDIPLNWAALYFFFKVL